MRLASHLALGLILASTAVAAEPAPATVAPTQLPAKAEPRRAPPAGVELNVRTFGAVGDGQPHPVREWIDAKKYRNLADLQREYPFVTSLEWSADEAAFHRALRELPPEGGTIRLPAGRYVALAKGWRIDRDGVRLLGAGARDTMLATGPGLEEGLVLAPYRHIGWKEGIEAEYPFAPDSGAAGTDRLRLRVPARVAEFTPGELVFIRNGACRFDQDYGEFNEVAGTTPEGDVVFRHKLSRDYTLAALNGANELAEPLTLPKPGRTVVAHIRDGENFHEPPKSGAITVGEALFAIVERTGDNLTLRNPPTGNPAAGTVLPAGTPLAKSRSIIKVTRTTRGFEAQGLRIFGRRKALNLSNSYESTFVDCDFVRRPDATTPAGGLTIDGDGGRFATFTRCTVRGTAPCGMQFARSFGNITFEDCTFVATNVVFSEFCFAGTLRRSRLQVPSTLGHAVIVGRSCGDLTIEDNDITLVGGKLVVFDAVADIHSQQRDAPGALILRDNRIVAAVRPQVYLLRSDRPATLSGNTLNREPVEPPPGRATP